MTRQTEFVKQLSKLSS